MIKISALVLMAYASMAFPETRSQPQFNTPFKVSQATYGTSAAGKAVCIRGKISVSSSANNTQLHVSPPSSQAELTQMTVDLATAGSSYMTNLLGGPNLVSGTFQIYAELCVPNSAKAIDTQTVLFLSHGASLDHTYWDFAPGYSYVDAAADAGYATFNYDRLGYGLSDHPDPNQVVQPGLQLEIAHVIIQGLRNTSVGTKAIKNVVGIGHSAGSGLTLAVVGKYPHDFDGLSFTGISTSVDGVGISQIAFNLMPAVLESSGRFKDLNKGYLTQGSLAQDFQFAFYYYPHFDPNVFTKQFNTRATLTWGELLTFGSFVAPQPNFTGPVDVVLGDRDYIFCLSNCSYPSNQAELFLNALFPNAAKKATYLQPNAGHLIAQHYTAEDGFSHTLKFLQSSGL
ncbi:alpha beta-hydrolase protein [Rutstroemia sp. NJR-2017a BVV2]|nr:alpha beta-hydrolase protein [Rutstroemia sp. NJR-2017a BVV2]